MYNMRLFQPLKLLMSKVFTSESVAAGHPDKVCDQISDAILDAVLSDNKHSRVACETLIKNDLVVLGGEITLPDKDLEDAIDCEAIVRDVIGSIGYDNPAFGFDLKGCTIIKSINSQSADINVGVDRESIDEQGAGDQGLMFGYASDETDALMPAPIHYAHRLIKRHAELRSQSGFEWLGPDAKSQLSVKYDDQGVPQSIQAVVFSTQHSDGKELKEIQEVVREEIINSVLPSEWISDDTKYHINPTGIFVKGGPAADCGVTGRKIIVDTYGGMARHGGGAFSGKDPSKVDRSAAYAARHVAKNIVAAGLSKRCEVQVSYAIGVAEPTSIRVDTFGTGCVPDSEIEGLIEKHFDLRPGYIIRDLDLLRPIYQKTAAYGHFGRDEKEFSWESCNKVDALKGVV